MADRILKEKWSQFIRSMGTGTTNGLLDELLEKRVLNQEEMEKIRVENVTAKDKARALLSSVIPKGPEACQICINHICENDYHLAGLLGLSSGVQCENHLNTQDSLAISSAPSAPQAMQDTGVLTFSGPVGRLKLCPWETFQKMWKDKSEEIYPMIMKSPARTRLALIICNTDFDNLPRRSGAEADIRNMKMLLTGLGYSVDVREKLNALDMATELKAFADRPEHCSSDSTFLVFMSHGTRAGICGKNYSEQCADILNLNTIFEKLNTRNCPNLKDKPKVIIIQACRGENQGVVWLKDSGADSGCTSLLAPDDFEDDAIRKAHIEKDFIAFCSSTPDNVSWRHPIRGSLFIMRLVEIMQEYAWSCDLEEIFRKVRFSFELTEGRVQMPTTERVTLTRRFYLFPGH